MPTAIIDSSPLISLVHLGLADKLSEIFDVVFIPSHVRSEVNRKSKFRYRVKKLLESGRFERCDFVDEANFLLWRQLKLDEGEAAALSQAQEREISHVIVDELRARKECKKVSLVAVGTMRIIARLHLEGYAQDPNLAARKLQKDLGFRISKAVVEESISLAPEHI